VRSVQSITVQRTPRSSILGIVHTQCNKLRNRFFCQRPFLHQPLTHLVHLDVVRKGGRRWLNCLMRFPRGWRRCMHVLLAQAAGTLDQINSDRRVDRREGRVSHADRVCEADGGERAALDGCDPPHTGSHSFTISANPLLCCTAEEVRLSLARAAALTSIDTTPSARRAANKLVRSHAGAAHRGGASRTSFTAAPISFTESNALMQCNRSKPGLAPPLVLG
jgi:hypothetical protein